MRPASRQPVLPARVCLAAAAAICVAACASAPRGPAPIQMGAVAAASLPPRATSRAPTVQPGAAPAVNPVIIDTGPPLQCVPYARQISGVQIFGDAVTWWAQAQGRYPRSSTPAHGSVLVMRGFQDATRGHVAVVTALIDSRMVLVDHANWLRRGEISMSVPVADVSPANDWSQVRVWHIPGAHWGGRTYEAEGFVHPIGMSLASGG